MVKKISLHEHNIQFIYVPLIYAIKLSILPLLSLLALSTGCSMLPSFSITSWSARVLNNLSDSDPDSSSIILSLIILVRFISSIVTSSKLLLGSSLFKVRLVWKPASLSFFLASSIKVDDFSVSRSQCFILFFLSSTRALNLKYL